MTALPVEWVLVIYYGPSAHKATYGRLSSGKKRYSKDYIQLSRKKEFMEAITTLFPVGTSGIGSVPLTFNWLGGSAPGALVFRSADRPHLKWETNQGAPTVWKMTPSPTESTAGTIPGNPSHSDAALADNEFALLQSNGAGQPYLIAVKLRDEPATLHLRAYLANADTKYAWADIQLLPKSIRSLLEKTDQNSALAWSSVLSGGVVPSQKVDAALAQLSTSNDLASAVDALGVDSALELAAYLRHPGYGLFFDPTRNHDAWTQAAPLPEQIAANAEVLLNRLNESFAVAQPGDAAAETAEVSVEEVKLFREQIEDKDYEVPDTHTTVKTRGSAQKAFSEAVKANYGSQCAITGIKNRNFLVAAHIVPWSVDQTIRLDPSNGICLSLLVDRAFENGHLLIDDDLAIRIDWDRVGSDGALRKILEPYDGKKIQPPESGQPKPVYLQRRRALVKSLPVCSSSA